MSGEKECPACDTDANEWIYCTGRPGCVRAELREAEEAMRRGERATTGPATEPHPAAGTQGGATDGLGTRVVDWPGESEISRLRDEVARLTAERDEADRRAGAAERQSANAQGTNARREQWLTHAKEARGYDRAVSFDAVWAETCAKADAAEADRHAHDIAVVKAALEAAAESAARWHETSADLLVAGGGWDARVDAHRRYARIHRERIPAIDPEAVLKAMEDGR